MSETNTGKWNTGDWNTGDRNTGDRNTGKWNTGDWNTGDRNTGDRNTGDWNTGDWNTGDRNTGDWNTGDRNTGYFNTITPDTVLVFNKPCARELFIKAKKPSLLFFKTTEWVSEDKMTIQERVEHPTFHTNGGYLRKYDYKEAFQKSWNNASEEDRELVKQLPNFDADVFFEISGIDVRDKVKYVEIDGKKYKLVECE